MFRRADIVRGGGDVLRQPFCQAQLLRLQALDLSPGNKEWSEQKRVENLRYSNPVKRGLVERPEDWFV